MDFRSHEEDAAQNIAAALDALDKAEKCRDVSIAKTHLDTALLWLLKRVRKNLLERTSNNEQGSD